MCFLIVLALMAALKLLSSLCLSWNFVKPDLPCWLLLLLLVQLKGTSCRLNQTCIRAYPGGHLINCFFFQTIDDPKIMGEYILSKALFKDGNIPLTTSGILRYVFLFLKQLYSDLRVTVLRCSCIQSNLF